MCLAGEGSGRSLKKFIVTHVSRPSTQPAEAPFGSAQYEAKLRGFPVSVSVILGGCLIGPVTGVQSPILVLCSRGQ